MVRLGIRLHEPLLSSLFFQLRKTLAGSPVLHGTPSQNSSCPVFDSRLEDLSAHYVHYIAPPRRGFRFSIKNENPRGCRIESRHWLLLRYATNHRTARHVQKHDEPSAKLSAAGMLVQYCLSVVHVWFRRTTNHWSTSQDPNQSTGQQCRILLPTHPTTSAIKCPVHGAQFHDSTHRAVFSDAAQRVLQRCGVIFRARR